MSNQYPIKVKSISSQGQVINVVSIEEQNGLPQKLLYADAR